MLLSPLCMAEYWSDYQGIEVEHQKMISTIEYKGNGQFKHQVETLLNIEKESLANDKVRYSISSQDFNLGQTNSESETTPNYITFTVDKKTGKLSNSSDSLSMMEKVNNYCLGELKEVTKENIGKTWKQSFDLSSFNYSMPKNLSFTLTAMNVNTDQYGKMTAVRALSEPFKVSIYSSEGKVKEIKTRIRAAYLFDTEIEDVYLSMSVFDAAADIDSKNEKLRYEVATYKTDSQGNAVDLNGLGKDFENFVRKVGLTSQDLKIEKETPLPQWAQSEGLMAAQMCNVCAAVACEGALNPVTLLTMPEVRTLFLQSSNKILPTPQFTPVSRLLSQNIPAFEGMKIAVGPAGGLGMGTIGGAAALGGATAGGVAIVQHNSGDDKTRSPVTP